MAQTFTRSQKIADFFVNAVARGILGGILLLPYKPRIHAAGWVFAHIIGPLSGSRKRIRRNVAIAWPELPKADVERMCRTVPDNFGRSIVEIYSGKRYQKHVKDLIPGGPGLPALQKARAENRPVVIVSAHFGGYDVPRSHFTSHGMAIGGLFREMSNPFFNAHYVKAMRALGEPLFSRDRSGMVQMVKHLKKGGVIAILSDQYNFEGEPVTFFGQRTRAAMSAAELALKYNALFIPLYARRHKDGINFDIEFEEEIPHSDPQTMMQAYYDNLEERIRKYPDQWLWIHKRWRPESDKRLEL